MSNYFFIKPLIADMVKLSMVLVTDPTSPQIGNLLIRMKEDIRAIVGGEWISALVSVVSSLFFATSTIIASAVIHGGKNLSVKELLLSTIRSLKRPFHTWFYTALFGLGYNFFVLANLLSTVLTVQHPVASKALCIVLVVLASVLYAYLAVVWILAFVISVLEEKSGIEALGKAAELVKGMQLHGFLLNLLYTISGSVLVQGIRLIPLKQSSAFHVIIGLLVINSHRLVWMFCLMAFTVFYHQCKKTHEEEVELRVSFEYSKIPTTLLIENIP
ncbi:hypothetical protein JRO89_XS06G0142500 [Xanthoceras sorbifolium]|uniref:Uncharacterized protein n=1 Tax=Xanthoceras sorbifolium TaxID=99658 RepID=A0ABQ8HYB8_9ROSI|nr:hypothetical protein JRO89_XS06G0142500 [Xanthoceras sorbifolium]